VDSRFASVMIQIRVFPSLSVYADRMRNPAGAIDFGGLLRDVGAFYSLGLGRIFKDLHDLRHSVLCAPVEKAFPC